MKIDTKLIAGMYELPNLRSSFLQDQQSCDEYMKLFLWALEPLWKEEDAERHGWCSPEELNHIMSCKALLERKDGRVKWLEFCPEYGCVIVGFTSAEQPPSVVNVEILGLNEPVFVSHGNFSDGEHKYDHFLKASGKFVTLYAGRIGESELEELKVRFQTSLASAVADRNKYVHGRRDKHPHTPEFVHAAMKHAIHPQQLSKAVETNNGGFPDYGVHSRGNPSNTSFPLACCLLRWEMSQKGMLDTYHKALIYIDLRLAANLLDDVKSSGEGNDNGSTRTLLEWAKCVVETAARKIAVQAAYKVDVSGLLHSAQKLDESIRKAAYDSQDANAKLLELSNLKQELSVPDAFRSLTFTLPQEVKPCASQDLGAIRKQAAVNIGLVPALSSRRVFDIKELDRFLKSPNFQADTRLEDALLITATVEEVFWQRTERGLDNYVMDKKDVPALVGVLDQYQRVICTVRAHLKGDYYYMKTEIFSRELLVVWIAYCLAFKALRNAYSPLLNQTGVALRYQDLEHLVLSEKRLYTVLLDVQLFLHQNYVPNAELFSHRCHNASFDFGARFTERYLSSIQHQELRNAEQRVLNHWNEVLKKKEKATSLEGELRTLRCDLANAKLALAQAQVEYELEQGKRHLYTYSRNYRRALSPLICIRNEKQQAVSSIQHRITFKESELEGTKQAPTPVIQPVPQGSEAMKQWILFLHAPEPVRALAALTFTAQQLLVPCLAYGKVDGIESSMVERLLVRFPACSVANHYNAYQSCYLSSGPHNLANQGLVCLYADNSSVPRVYGPQNIDHLISADQGVWYPDSWLVRMAWIGSRHGYASFGGREFDPFQITHELTTLYFTEQIDETIQWAIRQDGKPSLARGNTALASQSTRPDNLSRIAYVLLCSVRAFPNKQIRNVVLAFLNPSFPFEDPNVQKLLLQTIFQVGKVDGGSLKWKRDLFDNAFFVSIQAVLDNIEKEIHFSPIKSRAALLLGEVAAFFSSWNEILKAINRRIADAAVQWADDIGQEITAMDESTAAGLRVKECQYLYQAVLCLAKGQFLHEDVFLLVRLRCRCYDLRMGLNSLTDEQERELNRYHSRSLEALTARLYVLLAAVENDPSLLTGALREVVQAPSCLTWHPFLPEGEKASTCFETVARDGCVYTINILTGAVLVNGSPPSSLPSAIHQHPLFKRTLGNHIFE